MSAAIASSVTTLVGPDSDAHVYSPTPADAKKIADAKLIFINGLGFEGWLPRLVQSSGSKATDRDGEQLALRRSSSAPMPIRMPGNPSPTRDLCRQYPRCAQRPPIPPMPRSIAPMPRPIWQSSTRSSVRSRDAVGQIPPRTTQGDLHPRCLRLFRHRLWHRIHRAARRLHGIRAQRPRRRRDHHPDQAGKNPGDFS